MAKTKETPNEEAERLAAEQAAAEAERLAAEAADAERLAGEEAARLAAEEAQRLAAEEAAAVEFARRATEEAAAAAQLNAANVGPEPEAEPIDNRSPEEILADPGRPLTYGEILDLEARVRNAAA